MKDLKNIRQEWNIVERIAFYVREFHPEVYEEALDAIAKQEIEKRTKEKEAQRNKN